MLAHSMMSAANIPWKLQARLHPYAVATATLLDGLALTVIDGVIKTRFEHQWNCLPGFVKHLKEWGEAGVVSTKTDTTPKSSARGEVCVLAESSAILDCRSSYKSLMAASAWPGVQSRHGCGRQSNTGSSPTEPGSTPSKTTKGAGSVSGMNRGN